MKFAAIYGVVVGILIVAQWAFFLATGSAPELQTAPWSIAFHLAAELVLAITLVIGGIGVWQHKRWGSACLLVGLGMAIYSEIASSGYFAQQGTWALIVMFGVLLMGAVAGVREIDKRLRAAIWPSERK